VTVSLREAAVADAELLAHLYSRHRSFLEPFEPARPPAFFTIAGQRLRLEERVRQRLTGGSHLFLIVAAGEVVGTISLSNVVGGPFRSGNVGYWVAPDWSGQGIATAALGLAASEAFGSIGLHRLEAGTLLHNVASQRVLEKNGFRRLGVARSYLEIAGRYQDHLLFERTADDTLPAPGIAAAAADVRPAGLRDAGALALLLNAVAAEPGGFLLAVGGEATERLERRRIRSLTGSGEVALLVAERSKRIVGRADLWRLEHPHARHVAEIGLAVATDARRAGVGSALLAGAAGWCHGVGVSRLEALVFPHNAGSLAFFRAHGFLEEGILRGRYVRDSQPVDAILLARTLGS
jgi:ribosomal-protein-alanine N-acetyltransferase